jgi:hypothetical protein
MLSSSEILEEYFKCVTDPCHAIESYLKTFDKTQEGMVKFVLFPKQREIIQAYKDNVFNIVAKPRQAGVSTTTAAYAAVLAAFADKNNPEQILILANKRAMAEEFLTKIVEFLQQFPRWVWGDKYYGTPEKEDKDIWVKKNQQEVRLPNGSRLKAVATSRDALRGFAPSWLIMDEAAFIDDGADVFGAAMSSLSTGGRCSLISTPNGLDPLYYNTYKQSVDGDNEFNIVEMRWYEDPRYNKDLEWVKGDEVILETEHYNHDKFREMIKKKYKPTSSWYRKMCKGLNNDARMIAQELDVSFLGSGGNVIHDDYISYQIETNVQNPIGTLGRDKEFWVWAEPIEGHKYILSADVASGHGKDSSAFVIIDTTVMEQVMEYKGKLPPDMFAEIIYEWGTRYTAYVVIDNIGLGASTVLKLLDMNYKDIHYDIPRTRVLSSKKNELEEFRKEGNKLPGFNVSGVRTQMIGHLEEMIRTNGICVRSKRLCEEMRTFIYHPKTGKPDHMPGYHDDLLFSLGMGLWVFQSSFTNMEKAKSKTKAMLDAWQVSTPNEDPEDKRKEKQKPKFSPIVSKNMQDPRGEFLWLFK